MSAHTTMRAPDRGPRGLVDPFRLSKAQALHKLNVAGVLAVLALLFSYGVGPGVNVVFGPLCGVGALVFLAQAIRGLADPTRAFTNLGSDAKTRHAAIEAALADLARGARTLALPDGAVHASRSWLVVRTSRDIAVVRREEILRAQIEKGSQCRKLVLALASGSVVSAQLAPETNDTHLMLQLGQALGG